MPIDPSPADAPAVRELIDSIHRELMQDARLTAVNSWQMVVPGDCNAPDDGICTVTRATVRCTGQLAWHFWAGCTQEHLVEGWMCEPCLAEIENGAGKHWCASCRAYNRGQLAKTEDERQLVSEHWMILRKVAA